MKPRSVEKWSNSSQNQAKGYISELIWINTWYMPGYRDPPPKTKDNQKRLVKQGLAG